MGIPVIGRMLIPAVATTTKEEIPDTTTSALGVARRATRPVFAGVNPQIRMGLEEIGRIAAHPDNLQIILDLAHRVRRRRWT